MTPYIHDPYILNAAREGDEEALALVVNSHMGLVKSIALRFVGRGVELEDLIQIGSIGLVKAIRGFQPERECRLTTYAVPLIMGEIKRFLRDDGWIKVNRETRANAAAIYRFTEQYEKKEGRSPTVEEICQSLNLTEEQAVMALEASRPALSLSGEDEETGFSPEKIIGEDNIEEAVGKIALREVVARLPDKEKKLILFRYYKSLTQAQTARLLGWSQVKVSREEKRILEKLRQEFHSA